MPASFDGEMLPSLQGPVDLRSRIAFEEQGRHTGIAEHENDPRPRIAFRCEEALVAQHACARGPAGSDPASRNTADTGMRIMNAIEHYKLDISRAAFTGGENTYPYVPAFDAHLFLSANPLDVRKALDAGHAAATILPSNVGKNVEVTEGLRIAFDGDAVLFSDEAERVYKRDGLDALRREVTALRPA
jgi:5'-nucleotidase